MDFDERQIALRRLFTFDAQSDPEDEQGIAHWARAMILHVQEFCALRAEFGDCATGMWIGYKPDSETGRARKKAADDIRALRWGPDYGQADDAEPES